MGVTFNVPKSDPINNVDWDWIQKNYEPKTFEIISSLLSKNDCALEVGIDSAQTLLLTSACAGETIAIEPSKKSCDYANSLLDLNLDLKVKTTIINGCLSNINGDEVFGPNQKLFDMIHFNSSSVPFKVEGFTVEKIELLARKKISFINLDIEGGEFIVLPAMQNWLKITKPIMLLSLHPGFLLTDKQKSRPIWLRYFRRFIEQRKIYNAVKFYEYLYSVETGRRIKSIEIFRLKFVRSKSGQYSQVLCSSYDLVDTLNWLSN
jgi:FkbM family methyltransferase